MKVQNQLVVAFKEFYCKIKVKYFTFFLFFDKILGYIFFVKCEVCNDLTLLPYTFCLHSMINDLPFRIIRVRSMPYIHTYVHTTITTLMSKWKWASKITYVTHFLFTNNGLKAYKQIHNLCNFTLFFSSVLDMSLRFGNNFESILHCFIHFSTHY